MTIMSERDAMEAANARLQTRIKNRDEVIAWVETWINNPVTSYSVHALDGLFGMTRDKIALMRERD